MAQKHPKGCFFCAKIQSLSVAVDWLLDDSNLDKLARAEAECIVGYLLGKTVVLDTTEQKEETGENEMYRVQTGTYRKKENADAQLTKVKAAGFDTYMVQQDGMYKIQVGAYSRRANADNMLAKLKAAGFDAFIITKAGSTVAAESDPAKKTVDEIAQEVIDGKWSNGNERKKKLEAAGYNYAQVQVAVNRLCK